MPPNRLAAEASLYLRQHAGNPVDWQAWNEAALAEARAGDKPILLSIGYSACHWCHVMAHESFDDAATGALMNRLYVNIKVDREERPDLDRIYQLAHQALTRRGGGWPLTVFLDPHTLLPFFAGTYFPKSPRYGMPAFAEVLQGARRWWDEQRGQVRQQNEALLGFLSDYGREASHEGQLSDVPLTTAYARSAAGFDAGNGGHRGAPKFPHSGEIERWLAAARSGDTAAAAMATTTLSAMAQRGLHDHLAGGFFRYCVDERWDIPHFEKMLYDNALLLPLYAEAAVQFKPPEFRAAAEGVVAWLQAEMRAEGGGFCSALDADSEGVEGKFYLWTRGQFAEVLDGETLAIAMRHYGLDREPNFEGEAWHLHAVDSNADDDARRQLLASRNRRVRPARDDKRLTAWNALLCAGLARAGVALAREDWINEAAAIFETISAGTDARGRLSVVLGRAGPGFLDDHAYALQAALSLLRARWSAPTLSRAMQLADTLLRDFADSEGGGFHFTAHDHEWLPQRPKPWLDESTPAGNGVAAQSLLQLGFLLAEPRYLDGAEAALRAGWIPMGEQPQAASAMLAALAEFREPTPLVVIRGGAEGLPAWREGLQAAVTSPVHVYAIAGSSEGLPPALAAKGFNTTGVATLCRGLACHAESGQLDDIVAALKDHRLV
jgi:hypothetical protein